MLDAPEFKTLRQSRLSQFDQCALSSSFEEEYQAGWSTPEQASGTIFHRFAAKALSQMYDSQSGTIPTDAAISILDECLRQHDIDVTCPEYMCGKPIVSRQRGVIKCAAGHEHRSEFVNIPMHAVKDLRWIVVKWATDNVFDIDNLVDVEQRIAAPISYPDPSGGFVERVLTGQLDALFVSGDESDHFVVLDWKSGWALPPPSSVGFDGFFQQRFYAFLVFNAFPSAQKVTLREVYVRRSQTREATVFRADMDDVEAELSALAERFDRSWEEKNFPPSPGAHCIYCPRPETCPIYSGVRRAGAAKDAATAERFAREAIVAKSLLKNREDALKAYASVHGPIPISDHKGPRVWGYRARPRTGRPDQDVLAAALRANGGRLSQQEMEKLYVKQTITRFEPHVPEGIQDTADDAALMAALDQSLPSEFGGTLPADQGDKP